VFHNFTNFLRIVSFRPAVCSSFNSLDFFTSMRLHIRCLTYCSVRHCQWWLLVRRQSHRMTLPSHRMPLLCTYRRQTRPAFGNSTLSILVSSVYTTSSLYFVEHLRQVQYHVMLRTLFSPMCISVCSKCGTLNDNLLNI